MAGIDFGNMNCYLAVARNKGIEILTNDYSLHATPSCITFGQSARLMGYGSRQQLNIHYRNSVLNFKHLLGRKFSDQIVKTFSPFIPSQVVQLQNDLIGIKVTHLEETRTFSPEQVLACLFTHLRQLLSNSLGADVTECILNVPYFFGEEQRIALLTSGRISGLNFHLVNDHAALAFNYGMYKGAVLPKLEEPAKFVAFVDCGHSATQASIIAFNAGKAQIISAAYDLGIGGLHFDAILRDHFTAQFKDKYKIDVRKNPRAWLRLLDECEKMKKQMSANSQSIPLYIDCLMDDIDVNGNMQREEFEELAEPLFKKLQSMLDKLVQSANVAVLEQIVDVELIGGSTRMPRIKQIVAEFFKKEPKTTMNQDDAIARGCALRCAMFYPTYQMKEFVVDDPFEVAIDQQKLPNEEALGEMQNIEQGMQGADQRDKERSDAKNALEEYCFRVQHAMEDEQLCRENQLDDDLRLACISECQKVLDWMDAESEMLQKKQIECRHTELDQFCAPMMDKLYPEQQQNGGQEATDNDDQQEPPPPSTKNGQTAGQGKEGEGEEEPIVEEPMD